MWWHYVCLFWVVGKILKQMEVLISSHVYTFPQQNDFNNILRDAFLGSSFCYDFLTFLLLIWLIFKLQIYFLTLLKLMLTGSRSSRPEVFLGKGVLKICSKFTGEHPYKIVISRKLQSNFIEFTLWHGCSVNLLHIFRTPFLKNTSRRLLLRVFIRINYF